MKTFFISLKTSFICLLFLTILLGIIYPLFMYGVGQIFFHREANGSLFYYQNGKVIGSEWIGQNFTSSKYFHPRPSAAGTGYDASNSSGSNLGPTSQKLIDTITQRAKDYRTENKLSPKAAIPADSVTASGSGLDPHIGVANALLQVERVAEARMLSQEAVKKLIAEYTDSPTWGLFGEDRVNVLRLNLALDKISPSNG